MDERYSYSHQFIDLEKLNNFRKANKFCDFNIIVDSRTFPVHKLVIASSSDYFTASLLNDTKEARENKVVLTDVTEKSIEIILESIYSSKLDLDPSCVEEVLVASNKLRLSKIESLSVEFIINNMDITNCLGVLRIADKYNLLQLSKAALDFCTARYLTIIEEEEFREADEKELIKIISLDDLNVDNEEKVFDSIMKWTSFDPGSRKSKLVELMEHVRFPYMSRVQLVSLSKNELIQDSLEIFNLINEAKDYILLEGKPIQQIRLLRTLESPRFQPRKCWMRQIYAVGGWSNIPPTATPSVERYFSYLDRWEEVKSMTQPRCGLGVAILGDKIFAIGGHDGNSYLRSSEVYDIINETWSTEVADMSQARTSVCVASLNGFIYAIGGQAVLESSGPEATYYSRVVERFDPAKNEWNECSELIESRLGAGITVLNGLIYVVGGSHSDILKSAERYDPNTNQWTSIAEMQTARKHLGCATMNGRIYAVGGRDDANELDTGEYYDPIEDMWHPIASMNEKRSGLGLVELNGSLFAIGGHNGRDRLDLVESYDPIEDQWTVKQPMMRQRLGGGLVVHHNDQDYEITALLNRIHSNN